MDRRREWNTTHRISDVMRKQGPFLKMYSEYTNNYKKATQMFEEVAKKKRVYGMFKKLIYLVRDFGNKERKSHTKHFFFRNYSKVRGISENPIYTNQVIFRSCQNVKI
jgi:hypothetical protein